MGVVQPQQRTSGGIILIQHENRGFNDIGFALFAAFTYDSNRTGTEIYAFCRKVAEFLNAHTCSKHCLENQTVSHVNDAFYAGISIPLTDFIVVSGVDNAVDLRFAEGLGEERRFFYPDIYMVERGMLDEFLRHSVFKKCV